MAEYPRVSGSLRAFSGVGIQSAFPTADELRAELVHKRKRRNELQSMTWRDLKKIVDGKCGEKDKKAVSLVFDYMISLLMNPGQDVFFKLT